MARNDKLDRARQRAEGLLRAVGARIPLDGVLAAVEAALRQQGGSASAEAFAALRLTGGRQMLDALVAVAEPLGLFHLKGDRLVLGPPPPEPEPVTRHPSRKTPRPEDPETEEQRQAAEEMQRWLDFHFYGRVSTWQQAEGDSLDAQRAAVEEHAVLYGVRIVGATAEVARAAARRPGLEGVLELVDRGDVQGIAVTRADRLVRSLARLDEILRRLNAVGGALVATEDNADSRMPLGLARWRALALEAEVESARYSRRIREAMRYRQARGLPTNGTAPFGWALDGERLVAEPDEQEAIAYARQRRAEGRSLRGIARELGGRGVLSRRGHPFEASQVARMLAH